jgi:DNA-binding Xre family transcriptional regulator
MNPAQKLAEEIRAFRPKAKVTLDPPTRAKGSTFVDVRDGDFLAVVEWRPTRGFGISAPPDPNDLGEGPDEVYATADEVFARLKHLIEIRGVTIPRKALTLKRIREIRRLTQEELAKELDVKQATISKLEGREEIHVSTLRRVVAALGGKLELIARFDEGPIRIDLGESDAPAR